MGMLLVSLTLLLTRETYPIISSVWQVAEPWLVDLFGKLILLRKGHLLALASILRLWAPTVWIEIMVNGESLLDGVISQEAILGSFFKVSLATLVFPHNGLGILVVDVVFLGDLINTE